MQLVHEQLRKTFAWYDRWHSNPHSTAAMWGLFLLVSLTYTSVLLSVITVTHIDIEGSVQMSQVSTALKGKSDNAHGPKDTENVERLRVVNDAVFTKARAYAEGEEEQKIANLGQLQDALTERQDALRALALSDPRAVRRYIFDDLAIQSIPESVRSLIEKSFSKEGVFHIALVSDEFVYGEEEVSHEEYLLEVSPLEVYRLALTEEEAYSITPEEKVTITGMDIGGDVIVPTGEVVEGDGEGRVLGAAVTKKVAIIPLNFLNNTSQPLTVDQIRTRVFSGASSMSALYKEMSYGQMTIEGRDRVDGDVYDWVTVPVNGGNCAYTEWASLANDALTKKGVNLTGYTNIQYIFPASGSGCSWAGLAYMPGTRSWVRAESTGAGISGHEFGHNLGFHHASSYGCTVGTNTTGACNPSEYGDKHDMMGGGSARHTNNYNKARFWLDPAQINTVSNSGTFTITPTETTNTGVKLIRIKRPFAVGASTITNGYYHLEYRTATGFDSYLGTSVQANSVFVRLVNDYTNGGASKTYSVTTIPVGQTFNDAQAGISIQPLMANAEGATLHITMASAPCTRSNPTISIDPSGQWGSAGGSLSYTATVYNNDSETCGSSTFSVTPTLPTEFTQSPTALSLLINPQEQKSVSFSVNAPSTAVPAAYTFAQVVQNTVSTAHTASASANFNIASPDVVPPMVTITSPANGTKLKGGKVQFTASAYDASGVASIELSIDGITVKTCNLTTTCTYNWNLRKVGGGEHVLRAISTDNSTQKNRAETSITVTK